MKAPFFVHLATRAVGGAGLVMAEATAVSAEWRISPADTGIWKDEHVTAWRRVAGFIADHGAVPGTHAGWKACRELALWYAPMF